MDTLKLQTFNLKNKSAFFRFSRRLICLLFLSVSAFVILQHTSVQSQTKSRTLSPVPFRLGERLTYNISFEKFNNAAYAEIYVVSRGKLGDKDAVELRSKLKTIDFVSAAFYLLDETRTTFASAETGLPLYVKKVSNVGILPKETINNYMIVPTANYDLLTLIYQARNAGGTGNFLLQEDDRNYSVSLLNTGSETIKTDAGEFDTTISTAQSQFFTDKGITDLRINFSVDTSHLPVLIRFKTAKGDFRAEIASIQVIEGETAAEPTPTPVQIPRPQPTPKPIPTPTPYIENAPLLPELPFKLGETLDYQVSTNGKFLGIVTLQAKERKQFLGQDSLLLTATVTETQPGQQVLNLNDSITAQVSPDSLAPQQINLKFSNLFSSYNQTVQFDQKAGTATFGGKLHPEIPVGTHSVLSLAYAIRAFNLKPSKDLTNPVNDTRVAVFLGADANVFILRPSTADIINLKGEKVAAQLISVTTGNPQIDTLNLRLWLSLDEKRIPLRFALGSYQADLVAEKQIPPK
ncbi:hypothetical protein BH24ACI2_BH24ACI2_13970 [soil metagenome]|jgi:hypothetical protein